MKKIIREMKMPHIFQLQENNQTIKILVEPITTKTMEVKSMLM
jgi:hypothetical protein